MTPQQERDISKKLVSTTVGKIIAVICTGVSVVATLIVCTGKIITLFEQNNTVNMVQDIRISSVEKQTEENKKDIKLLTQKQQ